MKSARGPIVLLVLSVTFFGSHRAGDERASSRAGQDRPPPEAPVASDPQDSPWRPYRQRWAIIVMGGRVSSDSQHYRWYWNDTYGMYGDLAAAGFADHRICFLSYGTSALEHRDVVDGLSTVENIRAAYAFARDNCGQDDLLYVYWVDHGARDGFEAHDGVMSHGELGRLTKSVKAMRVVGAYNPCYSGAMIDDASRPGVITITSQDATHANSWGWAGQWRQALRGGAEADPVDRDGDGVVSFGEAFAWIAPKSKAAGEHTLLDDNGDGAGSEWGAESLDFNDGKKDGYDADGFSLNGWKDRSRAGERSRQPPGGAPDVTEPPV